MNIVECCEGRTVNKLSFEGTEKNSRDLDIFFQKYITEKSYIALFMTHNIHIPAIILSMKRNGHIFMPINKNCPDKEFQELVEEANIEYLIAFNEPELFESFELLDYIVLANDKMQLLKRQMKKKPSPIDGTLLCILSTSGTTGKRKLIKIESYCIEKNVKSLSKIFNVTQKDVIFFGTPLTFDPSLVELFLALESKATLLYVPEEIKLNPERLYGTLFHMNTEYPSVTFLQTIPSLFTRWTDKQIQFILKQSQLKILVLGGEPFPSKIIKFDRSVRLFNIYGITEVSCWATLYEVVDNKEIFLGSPLEETYLKVCACEEEIQDGIGELYIGSDTRHCYINNEMKKEKWRPTGDIVLKTSKGIKYLGRKDDRIKRLGHQIFLLEVERRIFKNTEIATKCLWHEEDSKLLLFISIESFNLGNKSKILDKLRVKLLHLLPSEEFPDFMDILPTFPITRNGKLDRRTLFEIYEQSKDELQKKSPSCVFLMIICKYLGHSWKELKQIQKFTFVELGGNSISYLLVTNELKDTLKCELPHEFCSLLLSSSIEKCLNFLYTFDEWEKHKISDLDELHETKKLKYSSIFTVRWKFNLYSCVDATPLVFEKGGRTYVAVGSFSNFFVILDVLTRETAFFQQLPDSVGNEASISPCLNFLYFGCFDGNLYCISLKHYNIAWSYQTGNSIKCKPSFCLNNKALVFGSYDKHVHCINMEDGNMIWRTLVGESIVTNPIIHKKKRQIVITTISGSFILISEERGEILWHIKLGNPIFSTSILIDNKLISCDVLGNIYFCDIDSQSNLLKTKIDSEIYSSIKYTKNHFILASTKGILYKFELVDNNCSITNSVNLGISISSTPTIYENEEKTLIAVASLKGNLYLIDFETLEVLSHWKCPGDIYSSCIFNSGKIYFGCRDDHLYCLDVNLSE